MSADQRLPGKGGEIRPAAAGPELSFRNYRDAGGAFRLAGGNQANGLEGLNLLVTMRRSRGQDRGLLCE